MKIIMSVMWETKNDKSGQRTDRVRCDTKTTSENGTRRERTDTHEHVDEKSVVIIARKFSNGGFCEKKHASKHREKHSLRCFIAINHHGTITTLSPRCGGLSRCNAGHHG